MKRLHKILLAGILILSGFLRLVNLNQPLWPDEALYAHAAKNLITRGELTFDGTPWTLQPPLFIFAIATFYEVFGISEFAARIVSPVLAIIGIMGAYYLGKYIYDENVGLLAAFFMAIAPGNWFYSRMIIADVMLSTLITVTLLLFFKGYEYKNVKYLLLSGLFIGATSITKKVGIVIYPIIILYLIARNNGFKWIRDKSLFAMFVVSLVFQLPWYIRNYLLFKDIQMVSVNIPSVVASLTDPRLFSFASFENLSILTIPILIFSLLGIYFSFNEKRKETILIFSPLFLFLYIHSFMGESEIKRYLIPIIPFFSIFAAYGLLRISNFRNKRIIILVLLLFTTEINLLKGSIAIESNRWKYEGYKEAGNWIKNNTLENSLILTNSRAIWYYSDRNCSYFPMNEQDFWNVVKETNAYVVISDWPTGIEPPEYICQLPERYPNKLHLNISANEKKVNQVKVYKVEKI